MATPTDMVTRYAQEFLGDTEVLIAIRVEWGDDAFARARSTQVVWSQPPLSLVFFPIRMVARVLERIRTNGEAQSSGVLALTPGGGRILMSTSSWQPKKPTGIVEVLPEGAALEINVDLMEDELIPILTVGDRQLVVNAIDFRALMKAVEAGMVASPEIEAASSRVHVAGEKLFG